MLRDERLQKVVADVDAAPDRERVGGGRCGRCVVGRLYMPYSLGSYGGRATC